MDFWETHLLALIASILLTVSLLTISASFTLFPRQRRCLILHPQQFFCCTFGRFLDIVEHSTHNSADDDSFILYLSVAEFRALQELAQETLRRPVPFHLLHSSNNNSYSSPNPIPNPSFLSTNFQTPPTVFTFRLLYQSTKNPPPNSKTIFSHSTAYVIFNFVVPHFNI